MTKITIAIPVFNSASTIEGTLRSLIANVNSDVMLAIYDNGSTDATKDIVYHVLQDMTFKYKINPGTLSADWGQLENYEKAISNFNFILDDVETDYCAMYHSDDIYDSNIFYRQMGFLENNTDCSMCFTLEKSAGINLGFIRMSILSRNLSRLNTLKRDDLIKLILAYGNFIQFPTLFYNVKMVKNSRVRFRKDFGQVCDLDFVIQSSNNSCIGVLNEELFWRKVHKGQDSEIGRRIKYRSAILPIFYLMDYILYAHGNYYSVERKAVDMYNLSKFFENFRIYAMQIDDRICFSPLGFRNHFLLFGYFFIFPRWIKYYFLYLSVIILSNKSRRSLFHYLLKVGFFER
jgi:hypothetical protein